VAANAVLVPRGGVLGAAEATLLGNVTLAISTYIVAQRVHRLPFRGARLGLLFAVALGLAIVAQHAPATPWGWSMKLGTGFAVIALALGLGIGRER
jgi:O-antigen/teichoic acid export membrane protein